MDTASQKLQEINVTTGPLPSSRKVYLKGNLHNEIRVPIREIDLHETANEPPVRVYDTSGPYSDPDAQININVGLARTRKPWMMASGDVEEYEGRQVRPEDNGGANKDQLVREFPNKHNPLRAKNGNAVTQIAYARSGIITPEMEYVSIRENLGREELSSKITDGNSFGAAIPGLVTPEFVRDDDCRVRDLNQVKACNNPHDD
jgi:phosphomethylpyrimidine synthase